MKQKRGKKLRAIYLSIYLFIQNIGFAWQLLSRISRVLIAPPKPRPGLIAPLRRPI